MKTKLLLKGLYVLIGVIALVCSSCAEEHIYPQSNNGTLGTLGFTWSQNTSGDTITLFCNQTLSYSDENGSHVVTPVATVKLFAQLKEVEYTAGTDPTPVYLKSTSNSGYEGVNPRCRTIEQKLYFNDDQVITALITMPIYSYFEGGRELFYPYIQFQELIFANVSATATSAVINFNLPWQISNGDESGQKVMTLSYAKKAVTEKDKLLKSSYAIGVDWNGTSFSPYVEKTEIWQIAKEKKIKASCPWLPFELTASDHLALDVTDFDFSSTLTSDATAKQDISQDGWSIKRGTSTKTVNFSNEKEFFANSFSYPLYDVSFDWNGEVFEFDLSVEFKETSQIAHLSETTGKNTTVATVKIAEKSFEKTVVTSMTKKTPVIPDGTSKYGKVLGYSVTAVFEPQGIKDESISITKKCVLIHYEKGYEWGICAYSENFPTSYTFTETTYDSFDSAAKRSASDEFELARTVESTTSILWYNDSNRRINGIDALSCGINGWENIVDGIYASEIIGYNAEYNNDYTITLTAPDGSSKTFSSY